MDYKTLGQNIRRLRVTQGFRQEDLAEKCECSASHIGQIENGRVKPSLEMTVRIANALNATTDQLLAHEFSRPEEIYLKEIAERIEKYPVSKRMLACDGCWRVKVSIPIWILSKSLAKHKAKARGTYDEVQTLTKGKSIVAFLSAYT